ncbi:hypothetical protein [Foetidibacter luteolus]|uniref:hypothetical protein n=1 Tax=Foetidibacter luteolus TaxID=2608880 RepID=UPI00129A9010|nr:hypothetical protein [Foetidibacter luteolus]
MASPVASHYVHRLVFHGIFSDPEVQVSASFAARHVAIQGHHNPHPFQKALIGFYAFLTRRWQKRVQQVMVAVSASFAARHVANQGIYNPHPFQKALIRSAALCFWHL